MIFGALLFIETDGCNIGIRSAEVAQSVEQLHGKE